MAVLMIKCPKTGQPVSTGLHVEPEQFARMPVFMARSYCAHCRDDHEWFAKDAWVKGASPRQPRCEAA